MRLGESIAQTSLLVKLQAHADRHNFCRNRHVIIHNYSAAAFSMRCTALR